MDADGLFPGSGRSDVLVAEVRSFLLHPCGLARCRFLALWLEINAWISREPYYNGFFARYVDRRPAFAIEKVR